RSAAELVRRARLAKATFSASPARAVLKAVVDPGTERMGVGRARGGSANPTAGARGPFPQKRGIHMNISWPKTIATAGLLLLYVLDGNAAALSSDEVGCRDGTANAVVKYLSSVLKTTAKCHKKRNHGVV